MHTEAIVKAENSEIYLKKLCKHFAHKVPATLNGTQGIIDFPFGRCLLNAEEGHLKMNIELSDKAQVAQAEEVMAVHLKRMASKEALLVNWNRVAAS
ncbi:DUF2218 domain-containing protein [Spongiibacter sp. KMU-158]|uniref:DUF2218 domain-containing protein n=1 Tax=Spongiibacter pelagi TaxID=2760804 RepID=A0A927C0R6_9GAMM|nr:DUF2218 domain-containing protein [Spongiibacter pelagi]MBD2858068.1 DUF2218 domain-containing protein [Spongiibacter pelagi]